MAVAMRKKRAWSTRADDAESQETAAFEATVAAAKDTAAKSGAFLSTAKSDLTDHQRWLRAQSAAVERDRQRHERFLQRQRNYRVAAARKERLRDRRRLMRQRALQSVRHAIWAAALFVRSWFAFAVAKIWAGIAGIGGLIARGVAALADLIRTGIASMFAKLAALVRRSGEGLSAGASWTSSKALASARAGGSALASGSTVFAFAVAKIWAGVAGIGELIARGVAALADLIRTSIASTFAKLAPLVRRSGEGLSAGASWTSSKALASARAGGSALASGSTLAASETGALLRSAGRSLSSGWSATVAKSSALAGTAGGVASQGFAAASRQGSAFQVAAKRNLASAFRWTKARVGTAMPVLYVSLAKLGRQMERYARAGAAHAERIMARAAAPAAAAPHGPQAEPDLAAAEDRQAAEIYGPFYEGFWVEGVSPNEPRVPEARPAPSASRGSGVNAPSSSSALSSWATEALARAGTAAASTQALIATWLAQAKVWADQIQARARTRDVELSRMMIIAGALLLICGGLLLGGGLFLRSGAGTLATPAVEEPGVSIAWKFMETGRPLPERAVFTLSGTPDSFRINGLSVGGVNLSDQPLTAVEGMLKPDVKRPDLKLTLEVDPQTAPAGEDGAQVRAVVPAGMVPAGAAFRLVFPFPPEAMGDGDGITVEEFFESYGGLLLKLRYEIDGMEKSLIQYLPPDLLKAQLDEVSTGS